MKRFSKTLFRALALVLVLISCLSLTACKKRIDDVQLKVQVYDFSEGKYLASEEGVIDVALYTHLAPKTCEAMLNYINEGYYDNAIIYMLDDTLMFGDLVLDGDEVVVEEDGKKVNIKQNAVKPTLTGEFEYGSTTGSNLTNQRGAVGLWRSYYDLGDSFTSTAGMNSGRATWYMPTKGMASYNGYYCVFGQINFENERTANAFSLIEELFEDSANYNRYVIYYTQKVDADGNKLDYDETKENANLDFHCVTKDYFDAMPQEEKDLVFDADDFDGKQLVCYNKQEIKVAKSVAGTCSALVKSASIVK